MRTRSIIAAILVAIGLVWVGQGLGFFGGSGFMDGDARWAAFGAILAILGIVVGWTAFMRRPPA